jgi:hypothetical protein
MQGRKTSVRGADYVVHLDRPGYYVWCGRRAETVNRVELGTGDEPAEEHCRTCVRCRAVAMHARLRARDAGRCLFCATDAEGRHEHHCELGRIFGTSDRIEPPPVTSPSNGSKRGVSY